MCDLIHCREKKSVNNPCPSFLACELELAYPVAGEPWALRKSIFFCVSGVVI